MSAQPNTADLAAMRQQQVAPREASMPAVAPGFGSLQSFELMQRAAKLLSSSTLVPAAYRAFDEKKGDNPPASQRDEMPAPPAGDDEVPF
jgi:hypothetical protein